MELTGLAVCASLVMAAATVCAFIWAVKKDYFRDIEDTKYQVFWSDPEDRVEPLAGRRSGGHPASDAATCSKDPGTRSNRGTGEEKANARGNRKPQS